MNGCEWQKCKYWNGKGCTEPIEYRSSNGDLVCGRRDDAIPVPQYSEKIDAIVYSMLTADFTATDWLALGAAAQDQAGVVKQSLTTYKEAK